MSGMTNGTSMGPDLEAALPPMASVARHRVTADSMPEPNYNALSERIRKSTPSDIQCSVLCGGRKCKYESAAYWRPDQMALPGIYSHWITDDVLAMSRPNTEAIKKYGLINTFHEHGIKTIINLQEPGEHSSCGNNLSLSGFSYEPCYFMDHDVYFYNFQWKDYSTVPDSVLLDMVKVMTFALTEGKVAVHCHAGLGRTGVFIASYLVYTWRCRPQDAIRYVRSKRPNSIQMRSQIESVFQFAQFVVPLFVLYPHIVPKHYGLNLAQHLKRQTNLLHGYEARHLRYIPKVLYVICERLLQLCNRSQTRSPGLLRTTSSFDSTSGDESLIDFQLKKSESFCKYFFAAATNSVQTAGNSRPQSNMTIQLSSGFASPDTACTELSSSGGSRNGTAESKKSVHLVECYSNQDANHVKNLLPAGHSKQLPSPSLSSSSSSSASLTPSTSASSSSLPSLTSTSSHYYHIHHQSQFVNSLPPVEELSDSNSTLFHDLSSDVNGPLRQIGLVGLDTPKRSKPSASQQQLNRDKERDRESKTDGGNRFSHLDDSSPASESLPNSPRDSLTSLIEKTLGYRVMQGITSPSNVVYSKEADHPNSSDQSDSSESYTNFEEVLARTGLVSQEMYQDLDENSLMEGDEEANSSSNTAAEMPVDPFLVISAILSDYRMQSPEFQNILTQYQKDLNSRASAWERLSNENNIELLSALLWSWLENLKEPIFNRQALTYIVLKAEKPIDALIKLETSSRYTCEYLIRFIGRLQPEAEILDFLVKRLVASLAHQCVKINGTLVPGNVTWSEMRKGTTGRVLLFLNGLYGLLQLHRP